jgi:hypothetical protein
MPNAPYRDFSEWAYTATPDSWSQTTGLAQLVVLTTKLYEGLISEEEMQRLVTLSVSINIYQVYEIVSDNIGIGLAKRANNDAAYHLRRSLINTFNEAMVARLRNDRRQGENLLGSIRNIRQVSGFTQSLSSEKHYAAAHEFLLTRPDLTMADLEYAIWPLLVANMESCVEVIHDAADLKVGPMVHQGFIRRYEAVNKLMGDTIKSFEERVEVSTHAILVVPIFAYYIGILCEKVRPLPRWNRVIEDNTLYDALFLAARMIRLLNDLGTNLIRQPDAERAVLMAALRDEAERQTAPTLASVLQAVLDQFDTTLTRIDKDLRHGEFNLGFTDLMAIPALPDALDAFERRLIDCADLYRQSQRELNTLLNCINVTLGDTTTSKLITRIVRFHEVLYAQSYREASGEYAV